MNPSILLSSAILVAKMNPSFMGHTLGLFSVDGLYKVVPQFKYTALQGAQESIDVVAVLLVEVNRHPVFFMGIKPPAAFPYDSKCEEADVQMRRRFRNLRQILVIPTLHGISAFGTRLAFYEYDSATQ